MTADTVVFSSWHGRVSDSPKAIAAELERRGVPLRQRWIDADAAPEDNRALLEGARFIVSNDVLPEEFDKSAGTTYLQTWHGTPLKRIGYDVADPTFPDHEYHYEVELGRDVARWDVMLSANPYSSEILPRAFRFDGRILETGYPRNDLLTAPGGGAVRERVRDALEIAADARVVLYAPTWRESFSMTLELDLEDLHERLGPEFVVLTRAHGLTAANADLSDGPGWRDVTAWPEITELYLAADILLTDYSSAMFDFAVTGRPQVFYTYDLDEYRDRTRGFYFDFEADAPGPLLRTTAEVADALLDVDAVAAEYRDAYARFAERFCPHEDGSAAARAVDAVFG